MTTNYPTTRIERLLLMLTLVLMPLEDQLPTIGDTSMLFLVFALLAAYVLATRVRALYRIVLHPLFLTAYIFLFFGFLNEFVRPSPGYEELSSSAFMIAGAVLIAALCRDKQALRGGMYAYIGAGIWLAALLFLTSYGALQMATAESYQEANRARNAIVGQIPLELDANKMALYVALGTSAAFALALSSRSLLRRAIFLGVALFCLVATFLPMSRGGIVICLGACSAVVLSFRARRIQALAAAAILGIGILSFVPKVVYSRMEVSTGARTQVYTAAIQSLPQYIAIGVGVNDYWGPWGFDHGFGVTRAGISGVMGAHNIFLQVSLYWGLASLVTLLLLLWQAARCLPKRCGDDALSLCLRGVATGVLLSTLFVHTLYDKHFSLALGLLVGARCWIWPTGTVRPTKQAHENLHRRDLRPAVARAA